MINNFTACISNSMFFLPLFLRGIEKSQLTGLFPPFHYSKRVSWPSSSACSFGRGAMPLLTFVHLCLLAKVSLYHWFWTMRSWCTLASASLCFLCFWNFIDFMSYKAPLLKRWEHTKHSYYISWFSVVVVRCLCLVIQKARVIHSAHTSEGRKPKQPSLNHRQFFQSHPDSVISWQCLLWDTELSERQVDTTNT